MSVLEIYIDWVNSVLAEVGGQVNGVEAMQDGKVLCELIDILVPEANLLRNVKATGDCTPLAFTNAALEHMKRHGIKIKFPAEDIVHNDVKSMLDVLWMLILNYGIHFIGQEAQNRNIGIGKKNLLEWSQESLGTTFDPSDTLTVNLCSGNWFLKLLEKITHHSVHKSEDKSEYIDALLKEIQDRYLIKKNIIKASDIVNGTVDEHALMIYLSLLKRRTHYAEQQTHARSGDSHRSNYAASAQDPEPIHGAAISGRQRSSSANPNLDPTHIQSFSEQALGDEATHLPMRSQFLQFEKTSSKQNSSSQHISPENESTPQTIRERVVEYLPGGSTDRNRGKEIESQMISEKETDTMTDFTISPSRYESVSVVPSLPQDIKYAVQSREEAVFSNQNAKSSTLNNSNFKYSQAENASRTLSDTTQRLKNAGSIQSHIERHSQRILEHRDRKNPREEHVRIRIKRPKDYLRQWEDTIDRLSAVSVTDEFGSPRSPLISNYQVSLPSRSKSLEAGGSSYRNPFNTRFEKYSSLTSRSKSSEILPAPSQDGHTHRSYIDHICSPESKTLTTFNSGTENPNNRLGRLARNSQHETQEASAYSIYTSDPEVSTLTENISPAREHIITKLPLNNVISQRTQTQGNITSQRTPSRGNMTFQRTQAQGNITSQRTQEQISTESNEQTILKKGDRSEPSSSTSRVHFQPGTNGASHFEQRSQSEGPQSVAFNVSSPTMYHRVNSLSPRRRTVNSRGLSGDGERGSDTMLSVSPRSRSLSPQQSALSARDPEASTGNIDLDESFKDLPSPAAYLPRNELLQNDHDLNARVHDDKKSSRINETNLSPGIGSTDHVEETYMLTSRKTSLERLPLNTTVRDVSSPDFEWDSDRHYVGHLRDSTDYSPPPTQRGGAGRIPRREAWEQERRRKEDVSILGSHACTAAQSKVVDALCKEIEVLKQKVEMLEEGGATHNLSLQNTSPSRTYNSRHCTTFSTQITRDEYGPSDEMKTPLIKSHERATSCPLLQLSSRSKATRSLSRSATGAGTSGSKRPVNHPVTQGLSKSNSAANTGHATSYSDRVHGFQQKIRRNTGHSSSAHLMDPEIWGHDPGTVRSFEPNNLEKVKQLISRRNLSEFEVTELKQALACALAENDILQAKLSNASHEVQDKLKHINGVLDDCRHHLAKAQAENMELRTMLEQEKQRSGAFGSRIQDLEKSILEVKTDNQLLESELDQTTVLLDHSLTKTIPGVDALRAENSRLLSRLTVVERENDALKEEVHILKKNQTKAMNTMDELRNCLSKIRQERQELFDELTVLQPHQQTNKVTETISSYQGNGDRDEQKREQDFTEETKSFPHPDSGSHFGPYHSSWEDSDRTPERLTKPSHDGTSKVSPQQLSSQQQQRFYSHYEESPTQDREIYPHRRGYMPRSTSYSPHREVSPASTTGYHSSLSTDKLFLDQIMPERDPNMKGQTFAARSVQYSQPRMSFSYSPTNHKTSGRSLRPPGSNLDKRPQRNLYSKSHIVKNSPNRSFISAEDFNSIPFSHTPHEGIHKGSGRGKHSAATRSRSFSSMRYSDADFSGRRDSVNRQLPPQSAYMERNSKYFTHRSHSPPTRLSPVNKDKKGSYSKLNRKPLHSKTEAGEIARKLQKEFDKEDEMITFISRSPQNKPWIENHNESDGEDTGINSSMSSRSSCERSYVRKKAPLLSDEQRRYADELIKKYAGSMAHKQTL